MAKPEYWTQRPTEEWKATLSSIPRFHTVDMIHRTNLFGHALRVQSLALAIGYTSRKAGFEFDTSTVERLAIHHDDPEVETTDIPTPVKRAMTVEQREELKARELEAGERLAGRFTTLPRDTYLVDQRVVIDKLTTEAQIVDVADKLDGLGETTHELRCGNEAFWPILENYRTVFSDLASYPIFECLDIEILNREDFKGLEIDVDKLKNDDWEGFWRTVEHPELPSYYKLWMNITTGGGMYMTLKKAFRLFPGWRNELIDAKSRKTGRPITEWHIEMEDSFLGII